MISSHPWETDRQDKYICGTYVFHSFGVYYSVKTGSLGAFEPADQFVRYILPLMIATIPPEEGSKHLPTVVRPLSLICLLVRRCCCWGPTLRVIAREAQQSFGDCGGGAHKLFFFRKTTLPGIFPPPGPLFLFLTKSPLRTYLYTSLLFRGTAFYQ